jgi:hypothetical protein
VITLDEARQIAERWIADGLPSGAGIAAGLHEFDAGYVVWGVAPAGTEALLGSGRGVIDRQTGELSVWPSVPVEQVVELYLAHRAGQVVAPRTWDPAREARRDLVRSAAPATVTHLTAGGRLRIVRSAKGDGVPNHHPLVGGFLAGLAPEARERGFDRCSEAVALSDVLHEEDARRHSVGEGPIGLDEVRRGLLRGAELVTYRVREPGDPAGGQPGPPCVSCLLLLQHLGFGLAMPAPEQEL